MDILMHTVASQNSSLMLAAIINVWPNFQWQSTLLCSYSNIGNVPFLNPMNYNPDIWVF